MFPLYFDSVSATKTQSYIDSIRISQTKIVENLDTLNSTAEKISNQHKFLGLYTYDTVFTVCVSLGIFVAGYIFDRLMKWNDYRTKKIKLQRYFKGLLDRITDKTCMQIAEAYKDTYTNTNLDTGILTSPPSVLTNIFRRIAHIKEQELLDSFKANNSKESISVIINHLEFLSKMPNEIEKYHLKVLNISDEMREFFIDNVSLYFKLLAKYLDNIKHNRVPTPPNNDVFLPIAKQAFELYQREILPTNKITRLRDEIIRPVHKSVVETNIYQVDETAGKIAELGQVILRKFYYLNKLTEEFCTQYEYFYTNITSSQKVLEEERAKIKWR